MPPHNLSRGDADIVAGLKYGTRFRAIRQDNRPLRSAPVRKPANASNTGPGSTAVSTRCRLTAQNLERIWLCLRSA